MPAIGTNFFSSLAPLVLTGSLPAAAALHAYDSSLTIVNAAGGGTWTVGAGLPYWASINASTGHVTGSPLVALTATGWLRGATPGQAYSSPALTLTDAAGGGVWTKGAGAPAWLTINASTGAFGGSP